MIPSTRAPVSPAPDPITRDPLRAAAEDLHREFLSEMLKQARLTEALGGTDEAPDLGGALASVALDQIAVDVARTQPALTDALYAALRRAP